MKVIEVAGRADAANWHLPDWNLITRARYSAECHTLSTSTRDVLQQCRPFIQPCIGERALPTPTTQRQHKSDCDCQFIWIHVMCFRWRLTTIMMMMCSGWNDNDNNKRHRLNLPTCWNAILQYYWVYGITVVLRSTARIKLTRARSCLSFNYTRKTNDNDGYRYGSRPQSATHIHMKRVVCFTLDITVTRWRCGSSLYYCNSLSSSLPTGMMTFTRAINPHTCGRYFSRWP